MARLDNKVAIVTGASSGIGRAAALLFARQGASVVLAARREDKLHDVVEEIGKAGGEAVAIAGDVRDEAHHEALVDTALSRFGGLDAAFNNAGDIGRIGSVVDLTAEDWRAALDVNLTSAFLAARHQVPALEARGGGSLVFTSTFVGYSAGFPGMAAYAASKSGLVGLVQVLASEFGSKGIRVNALLPGGTDTPMGREVASTPEARDFVAGLHALKRMARPEEIAAAALYLASEGASFVTGTAMLVDGGVSITRT